jgi:hypothetical protein
VPAEETRVARRFAITIIREPRCGYRALMGPIRRFRCSLRSWHHGVGANFDENRRRPGAISPCVQSYASASRPLPTQLGLRTAGRMRVAIPPIGVRQPPALSSKSPGPLATVSSAIRTRSPIVAARTSIARPVPQCPYLSYCNPALKASATMPLLVAAESGA